MKLLIVDDHVLFREGLSSLFRQQPDFEVVGEAGSAEEAVQLAARLKPDLVLMDFSLGDGTGAEATQAILSERPETRVVFLTMHEDDERLFTAIRSGAKGYLLKNLHVNKLLAALRALDQGEAPLSPTMTTRLLEEFARLHAPSVENDTVLDALTERELEVFRAMARGESNQEIAERLFISENTVKNHVHNILDKLNLENRRDVARFASRRGLKI